MDVIVSPLIWKTPQTRRLAQRARTLLKHNQVYIGSLTELLEVVAVILPGEKRGARTIEFALRTTATKAMRATLETPETERHQLYEQVMRKTDTSMDPELFFNLVTRADHAARALIDRSTIH